MLQGEPGLKEVLGPNASPRLLLMATPPMAVLESEVVATRVSLVTLRCAGTELCH